MSSSNRTAVADANAGADAAGWPVPGTDGDVVLPWVLFVVGSAGPLAMVAPDDVVTQDDGSTLLTGRGAGFSAVLRWAPVDDGGGADVELTVTYEGAAPIDASVGLSLRLRPTDTPWFLVPGLFYGENRPAASTVLYPRFALAGDKNQADAFVSDRWAFRSDRAATPVVIASDGRYTAAIATTEQSELGPTGLAFSADEQGTGVGIFAPYHEQPVAYDGGPDPRPGFATYHRWRPGEHHAITARVHVAGPDRYAFRAILRDLHRRLASPDAFAPSIDVETLATLAAEGLLRWHWLAEEGVLLETAAFERGPGPAAAGTLPADRRAMHVAWLSGAPAGAALLAHGRRTSGREAVEAGTRVIDSICANRAPAGTFWSQWTDRGWGKGWTPGPDAIHARTLAEACLFVTRAAIAERERGVDHPAWLDAVRSNLDFAVARQRDDGALGSAYDARTGTVLQSDGAAGLAWAAALVEGSALLDRPDLIEAATRAGSFYARFVEDAFIHGAPEDVDLAPSSEDGYAALMSYVALAERATSEVERSRWVAVARDAADWLLTFRYSYDVAFEPLTAVGSAGLRTRGLDQASVMNQHLHVYGLICTPELVRLGRLVGDPWFALRAYEHLAAATQTIVRSDGHWNGLRGMAAERFYQTACFGPKGGYGALSHAWCLGLLLFAAELVLADPGAWPELAFPAPAE